MCSSLQKSLRLSLLILLLIGPIRSFSQQVVERGALGKPSQVLDETGEWTTPLLLVSGDDVAIYMPDITNMKWLEQNYPDYRDRGNYTLTLFTFYKTPEACKINQTKWGLGDYQHLNDCSFIGYRMRRAKIDPHEKSVTLIMAAMVDAQGNIQPDSVQTDKVSRFWNQLDENSQEALKKANELVAEQMKIYDRKVQNLR